MIDYEKLLIDYNIFCIITNKIMIIFIIWLLPTKITPTENWPGFNL